MCPDSSDRGGAPRGLGAGEEREDAERRPAEAQHAAEPEGTDEPVAGAGERADEDRLPPTTQGTAGRRDLLQTYQTLMESQGEFKTSFFIYAALFSNKVLQ